MNSAGAGRRTRISLTALTLFLSGFFLAGPAGAQSAASPKTDTVVVPGPQYAASSFFQKLWGKHYRREWTTPVRLPLLPPDSAGHISFRAGMVHREMDSGSLYNSVFQVRPLDRKWGATLPERYRGTFVENMVNNAGSGYHPYAPLTIAPLAKAAGIYAPNTGAVVVSGQAFPDTSGTSYGRNVYLVPDLPGAEMDTAMPPKGLITTRDLLKRLTGSEAMRADQHAYARVRLFQMLVGNWNNGEEAWLWSGRTEGSETVYRPVPVNNDAAYSRYEGALLKTVLSLADLDEVRTFEEKIANIREFNYAARNLDRQLANSLTEEDWASLARELHRSLTDTEIEAAIRRMPPEVFALSGDRIIRALKQRRNDLEQYARTYYRFLADEVDIRGSLGNDRFVISRGAEGTTTVRVSRADGFPVYSRTFSDEETDEIRLYGLGGNDVYQLEGREAGGTKIRIIGGPDRDSITGTASGSGKRIRIYDDRNNAFIQEGSLRRHLSRSPSVHTYRYDATEYDKKGLQPLVFYESDDRLYAGIGYRIRRHHWRKDPFASDQKLQVRYSIPQKAPSVLYQGTVTELIGRWNGTLLANWDAVRWTNFFGLGNETERTTTDNDFYRLRSKELLTAVSLNRRFGTNQIVNFTAFYQNIKLINDTGRYVAKNLSPAQVSGYRTLAFGGGRADYTVFKLNHPLVPTKGVLLSGSAAHTVNLKDRDRSFSSYAGNLELYVPITRHLVLSVRSGASTVTGNPEFYQNASVGGGNSLRGFRRDRFWGKTAFFDANELQWIGDFRSKLFNGKAGLVGFYDLGRVWLPGEESDTWHSAFGGGVIVAPFDRVMLSALYGRSSEAGVFHLRVRSPLW